MKDMDMVFGGSSEEPTPIPGISPHRPGLHSHFGASPDLELIEEVITEDNERSVVSLPGPPPPPGILCENAFIQNHRPVRHGPSATSKLVARGTPFKPNPSQTRPRACPSRDKSPTHPSRVAGSLGQRCSSQNMADEDYLQRILEKPKLVVVEEPKDRGMRFRYECEGRSAGSILGASSTDTNKTQPAIEIQGHIDHLKKVTVTVSLVTKDPPHRPHPHCLVGKDCPNGSGICVVSFNPHSSRRHSFANLGIQCVRRKELDMSLQKRRSQNIDPFQTGHSKGIEDMDMNAVRLCFQCELELQDGRMDSLSPVISSPIYDKKATTTSQLKICLLNQSRGPCTGKTEVYMLCDKVQKDDIEIIFRQGSWKANGEFAQTDVHRQIAIVFKTPPYQDQDLTEEVEVSVALRRISDQMESEPVTFTYLPHNPDPYEVKRKRRTRSNNSFTDKACVTAEIAPASDQAALFFSQNMISPDERSHVAQPTVPALADMRFCEGQDSNSAANDDVLINELLETPEIWNLLSEISSTGGFEQPPDSYPTIPNMDMNFNANLYPNSYQQDFSQYSDMQFNMLVNESQNPPSESQEQMVLVKTEEEL